MKVKIELTIDVDVDGWNTVYGTSTPAEVRKDVKEWIKNTAYAHPDDLIDPVSR